MVSFLTTLFLGKPSGAVRQFLVSIILPEPDNLLFLNRDQKKMEIAFQRKMMCRTKRVCVLIYYIGKSYFLTGQREKGYQFQNVEHTI